MRFDPPLVRGRLVRRYKRFLADVDLDSGKRITVHCPNTGAMLGCQTPGSRVWLSTSDSRTRKYRHTWELVETAGRVRVGINTGRSNALVAEALQRSDIFPSLAGYRDCRPEVPVSDGRLDFRLSGHRDSPDLYLEVKNVTAAVENGVAMFPDAASERARRHLETLAGLVTAGFRAALVFCIQREDVRAVRPADEIDHGFGIALRAAAAQGVEILAARASVSPARIALDAAAAVQLAAF